MSKKIIIPSSKEMMDKLKNEVDGFILGVENLSVNLPTYFNIDEIIKIINDNRDKEIFISLNKNMHNSDLKFLKEVLIELDKLSVKAVIYYDISIVNIKRELGLKLDLVWNQEHMTNNYFTINYWMSKGAEYTMLSGDITLNEIQEIRKNTNSMLMIPIFGYIPMFTSYRHLINNYLETFNLDKGDKEYYLEKEDKRYPIVDNNNGTTVYSNNILNGIREYLKLNDIEYVVLNSYNIELDKFIKIIELFNNVSKDNVLEYGNIIDSMFKNTDRGFFYKETVYKVKNND